MKPKVRTLRRPKKNRKYVIFPTLLPDVKWMGPYATKAEAQEDLRDHLKALKELER